MNFSLLAHLQTISVNFVFYFRHNSTIWALITEVGWNEMCIKQTNYSQPNWLIIDKTNPDYLFTTSKPSMH